MNQFLKRLRITSLSLGVMAASGLVYNLILFAYLRPMVLNFEALGDQMERLGILTGLSLAMIGVFHLCTAVTLLLQITVRKSTGSLKVLAFVIGIISGLLLLSDLSMLQDIGKEYEMGWDTAGEWTILFINHALHALFTFIAFPALLVKSKEDEIKEVAIKDDVLFATANTTGLLSGAMGLLAVILAVIAALPSQVMEAISITIMLLILLPYLLILGIWLYLKRREKIKDWLDEKQFQDISRASLWTITLLLPCMVFIGIFQRLDGLGSVWNYLWLPLYVFLSMVIFSSSTLYSQRFQSS